MTMPPTAEAVVVSSAATTNNTSQSYVDWPAIFAGIVLASAIALVLLTFGSAIGLSFANFHGGSGVSPVWIGIAAASWLLWVEVSSMMCGGYLTGRMRRRVHDATEHESDVRDGAHGLIVWGGALIIGAVVAISGVGAGINAVRHILGQPGADLIAEFFLRRSVCEFEFHGSCPSRGGLSCASASSARGDTTISP